MDKRIKYIDPWLILLLCILGIAWIFAGNATTPDSKILALQNNDDPQVWIDALVSGDRSVREYARENLIESLPPESLRSVALEACESDDKSTQHSGLWILANVDIPGSGEIAVDFLNDETMGIRKTALEVLARDPIPDARDQILLLTEDPDSEVKAAAISALASLEDPDDIPTFISFLSVTTASVREASREAILSFGLTTPETISYLFDAARDSNIAISRESLDLIGEIGDESALDGLFNFLENGPVALVSDAATAIGAIGGDEAIGRALEIYRTSIGHIKSQAARVLGVLAINEAGDDLWNAVLDDNEDFQVRFRSLEALANCGNESLVPDIIRFISNTNLDPRLIRTGVETLGGLGGEEVLDVYDSVIADELDFGLDRQGGETALIYVIKGLGRMRTEESRNRLVHIAEITNPDSFAILRGVIDAFGNVGTPDDIELLQDLSNGQPFLETYAGDAISLIEQRSTRDTEN